MIGLALAAGCATDLDVRKLEADQERVGVGYILPFTQYKTKITWTVVECVKAVEVSPSIPAVTGAIKVAAKVEIEEGVADDAAHAYVVDPTQLQSLLSISSFQMKWQDGRNLFSTINVSSEDRTAQVIGKTATGLGKLALAVAALGGPAAQACREETLTDFQSLKEKEAVLNAASADVKAAERELKAVNDRIATMGGNVDDTIKKELNEALKKLTGALVKQSGLTQDFSEARASLTYVRTIYWPEASDVFATPANSPYRLPDAVLDRWSSLKESDRTKLLNETSVHLQIARAGSFGRQPGTSNAAYNDPATPSVGTVPLGTRFSKGLRYRMPAQGRVFACASAPCGEATPDLYTQLTGPVAQLGYVNVLPVRTRRFGSTVFAAELSPIGALKSAGYEEEVAAAENAATAFGDVVSAVTPLIAYDAASKSREQAEELADLDILKKKRDALKALQDDANADVTATVTAMTADTALLNAQIANLNAQITLAEARLRAAAIAP